MRVPPEGAIGLVRTVRRRGEPVRAEADPREERHERDLVEDGRIGGIPPASDDLLPDSP